MDSHNLPNITLYGIKQIQYKSNNYLRSDFNNINNYNKNYCEVSIMKQLAELLETGIYESIQVERKMTVADLLEELNLEGKYFGILVNGKKAEPETKISETDQIVILPHIAGGI